MGIVRFVHLGLAYFGNTSTLVVRAVGILWLEVLTRSHGVGKKYLKKNNGQTKTRDIY